MEAILGIKETAAPMANAAPPTTSSQPTSSSAPPTTQPVAKGKQSRGTPAAPAAAVQASIPALTDPFARKNRLGIPARLHRIAAIRGGDDFDAPMVGLTFHVGRHHSGVPGSCVCHPCAAAGLLSCSMRSTYSPATSHPGPKSHWILGSLSCSETQRDCHQRCESWRPPWQHMPTSIDHVLLAGLGDAMFDVLHRMCRSGAALPSGSGKQAPGLLIVGSRQSGGCPACA